MKAQKIISIITIIVSLSLIVYMCVMMARDSGGGSILDPTSSNNIVMINTPAPETSGETPAATQAATPTPAAPTTPDQRDGRTGWNNLGKSQLRRKKIDCNYV